MDQHQNPLDYNPLGQIAQEIYDIWRDFSERESSGIPQLKREAEIFGSSVEIKLTIKFSTDMGAEALRQSGLDPSLLLPTETPNITAEAEAALIGLQLSDIKEIENQQSADQLELVLSKIRETAPRLSFRTRNWISQFSAKRFPELGISFEKAPEESNSNIDAQKFWLANMYADKLWLTKVEEIIVAALKLPNPLPVLGRILGNMKRLEGLPDTHQN